MKPRFLLVAAAFLSLATAALAQPLAVTQSGAVAGMQDGAVTIFKGIPYAAPPVGSLRWEPPAPPATWSGSRDASAFGASCPQPLLRRHQDQRLSEDCLFLNVWSFDHARKAPVMVWIHGGAFRFGSGAVRYYDGTDFARDGVILVTINYRLGALGFFAHPALTRAAAPGAPLGNYGIMDQLAALKWVKRNIAAFGGDPDNVTVSGESAGARSVLALLALPAAKGLFARAIVESGRGWSPNHSLADEEKAGVALAVSAGLGPDATLAQLRALPPEKFLADTTRERGPFEDGRLIKQNVTQVFAAARQLHVPLIIGSNDYEASLMASFGISADEVLARLPASAKAFYPGHDQATAAALFTDSVMGAPARWIAAQTAQDAPAYLYHFSYVPTLRRGKVPGAQHGGEIPFVFGSWPAIFDKFASPQDKAMESLMHACWVSFAKTGKPACGDKAWPAYAQGGDALMEFGEKSGPVADFRKPQYGALEKALLPQDLSAHLAQ